MIMIYYYPYIIWPYNLYGTYMVILFMIYDHIKYPAHKDLDNNHSTSESHYLPDTRIRCGLTYSIPDLDSVNAKIQN